MLLSDRDYNFYPKMIATSQWCLHLFLSLYLSHLWAQVLTAPVKFENYLNNALKYFYIIV